MEEMEIDAEGDVDDVEILRQTCFSFKVFFTESYEQVTVRNW